MIPKLTSEQRKGVREDGDRDAIREGIADMEAGRVLSLEDVDARIGGAIQQAKLK